MKIVCDPAAASEAMDTIAQRHEALMGHLWAAIRNGIEAHNTLCPDRGLHIRIYMPQTAKPAGAC